MKILSNKEYDKLMRERKELIDAIDYALTQFAKLDRTKGVDPVYSGESVNELYFWGSIGYMKSAMVDVGAVDKENEWIEP